jgi:hypothetical protein
MVRQRKSRGHVNIQSFPGEYGQEGDIATRFLPGQIDDSGNIIVTWQGRGAMFR